MSWSPNWTDEYREIVEFYWWEPQMLGRSEGNYRKYKTADEMWTSLSRKEVPLNHILNIFFQLFPLYKIKSLRVGRRALAYSSRQLEQINRLQKNFTQPDFFIEDDNSCVAIELKTSSKSSHDQVEKYLRFAKLTTGKDCRVLLLTPYSKNKVFEDDITEFEYALGYLSFDGFCEELASLRKKSSEIERKLIDGLLSYFAEYFDSYPA